MSKGGALAVAGPQPIPNRRVPGRAVETNPLAAVVMFATAEHVHDLDKEITATENYLAGLKAMRQVAGTALGVPPPGEPAAAVEPAVTVEPAAAVEEAEVAPAVTVVEVTGGEKEPARSGESTKAGRPKVKTGNAVGRPLSGASALIAEVLHENIDMPTDEVFKRVRQRNAEVTDKSLKSLIYVVRSRIKDSRAKGKPLAYDTQKVNKKPGPRPADPPAAKPAAAPFPPRASPPAAKPEPEKKVEHLGGIVDDDKLRRRVAEYLFKKGLASSMDIVRDCGVDGAVVSRFMNHAWFEYANALSKWRLTGVGKQHGIDW